LYDLFANWRTDFFKQKQFDKGKTVERRRRKTKGAKASNRNASQLPDLYQRFFTYPTTEG